MLGGAEVVKVNALNGDQFRITFSLPVKAGEKVRVVEQVGFPAPMVQVLEPVLQQFCPVVPHPEPVAFVALQETVIAWLPWFW